MMERVQEGCVCPLSLPCKNLINLVLPFEAIKHEQIVGGGPNPLDTSPLDLSLYLLCSERTLPSDCARAYSLGSFLQATLKV